MGDFVPSAKVIADSVSPSGQRLTTIEVSIHRFMLPEFNTHRVFSRNSASSRAIPVSKTLQRIAEEPAVPLVWATEKKGMQGGAPLNENDAQQARAVWLACRDSVVSYAETLLQQGVHKSIVNRLLEPFMSHTVVVTATEWTGFFDQRCTPERGGDPLAQAEIVAAADAIRSAMDNSNPREIPFGGWHTPYVDDGETTGLDSHIALMISAARCARVSYLNHAGKRSIPDDIALYNRLVQARPPHASPLEHVATPAKDGEIPPGNFTGWFQLRHQVLDHLGSVA